MKRALFVLFLMAVSLAPPSSALATSQEAWMHRDLPRTLTPKEAQAVLDHCLDIWYQPDIQEFVAGLHDLLL